MLLDFIAVIIFVHHPSMATWKWEGRERMEGDTTNVYLDWHLWLLKEHGCACVCVCLYVVHTTCVIVHRCRKY